jgi:hypothetical protein
MIIFTSTPLPGTVNTMGFLSNLIKIYYKISSRLNKADVA